MTSKLRSTVYLVMVMFVLLMTAQAMAQSGNVTTPSNENELTGVVTALTPTTVTVAAMTFDIVQAEVKTPIMLGDVVKVHFTVATDGTLVVREVQPAVNVTPEATTDATAAFDDHGQDNPAIHANESELTGRVTDITLTTVTIGTMTFDIAQAETNDSIMLGDVVKVHFTVATDGTLVVREVQLAVNVTPEATEDAVDDHGQDNPATHIEDQHQGQDDRSQHHGLGSTGSPAPTATQIADDHGQDGAGSQAQSTPQPQQEDQGGHQGADDSGHGGHGG